MRSAVLVLCLVVAACSNSNATRINDASTIDETDEVASGGSGGAMMPPRSELPTPKADAAPMPAPMIDASPAADSASEEPEPQTTPPPGGAVEDYYKLPANLPPPGEMVGPDTYSCLDLFTGPLKKVAPAKDYDQIKIPTWEEQARFDMRGSTFKSHVGSESDRRAPYTIQYGVDWGPTGYGSGRVDLYIPKNKIMPQKTSACVAGGIHIGTQGRNIEWDLTKDGGGGTAITVNGTNLIMEGLRIDNVHDGYMPYMSVNPIVRHNWISHSRDDTIENDAFAAGMIVDNLFDGCYMFYSGRNPPYRDTATVPVAPDNANREGVLKFVNNLVLMKNFVGSNRTDGPGYGNIWKVGDATNPKFTLINNVFAAEVPKTRGNPAIIEGSNRIEECRDNLFLWFGDNDYPYPTTPCWTVVKGAEARMMWFRLRDAWIKNHPKVPRLPTDPKPDYPE